VLAAGALILGTNAALAPAATAVSTPQDKVVSEVAARFTPHVLDGQVNAVVQVGDMIILGGVFSQVRPDDDPTVMTRNNIVAFSATTGVFSTTFVPSTDGEVTSLLVAPDNKTVWAGGFFNNVNGAAAKSLVRLKVSDGSRDTGFVPPVMDGRVKDLKLSGGRLWVSGTFANVAGTPGAGLVTLNPNTGARDSYMGLTISGVHNGGVTQVLKFDIAPNGQKLIGIGNFTTVAGQARRQIFMLNISGPSAALANWQTNQYTHICGSGFQSYMRDLDISPDGRFFVVSTTGGYGSGSTSSCDTTQRFEVNGVGTGILPTWVDKTGGDTTYAVAITGTAVYVGGHFRWQNNPFAGSTGSRGAVAREGIAALDPANGLPLQWNPGRTKGIGVFDMLATPQGLWVASDTDRISNFQYHGRIALLPLAGGKTIAPTGTGTLGTQAQPGTVYQAGRLTIVGANDLQKRTFDGANPGPTTTQPASGIAWGSVRGTVMINGTLYYGWSDSNFYSRTFDGTTFGPQVAVNTHDLISRLTEWHNEVPNITSMFFKDGRLYFTLRDQAALYYRYFTPENKVIGALRYTASGNVSGIDFRLTGGAMYDNGKLYLTNKNNGTLHRIDFVNGALVAGTAGQVSGPLEDGADWRTRGLFLYAPPITEVNQPPVADAQISCTGLNCNYSGTGSTDAEGAVFSHAWKFGDGDTYSGATATHTYATPGTYQVALTVTDLRGATNTVTRSVTVNYPDIPVSFVGKTSVNANAASHQVAVPAGVAAGDGMLLFATANSATATINDPAGWTLVRRVQSPNGITTKLWQRRAGANEPATVNVTLAALAKTDILLTAYRGTAPTGSIVAAEAGVAETASTGAHVTPKITTSGAAWIVSYWADNSSATTAWTAPAGQTIRSTSFGIGGGRICTLSTDTGGPVAAGEQGGLTGTANSVSAKATMWTVALTD
jgi:PKD repeat protein